MPNAGEVLKKFYAAVVKKDIAEARRYLNDDLLFLGLFGGSVSMLAVQIG